MHLVCISRCSSTEESRGMEPVAYVSHSIYDGDRIPLWPADRERSSSCHVMRWEVCQLYSWCDFNIETAHKPLVSLLGIKQLDSFPPRVLQLWLRLARYDYIICHFPGKLLYSQWVDTLSLVPVFACDDTSLQEEAEALMEVCVSQLAASKTDWTFTT